jgi:hypothetical protein
MVGSEVKQSHHRPGQALRVPGGWGFQISRHSAHESSKVVSRTHRSPLPPRKYSWYSFLLRGWANSRTIAQTEGLCQWKIPVTPQGIEPATFRLLAQCLNQLSHRVTSGLEVVTFNVSIALQINTHYVTYTDPPFCYLLQFPLWKSERHLKIHIVLFMLYVTGGLRKIT